MKNVFRLYSKPKNFRPKPNDGDWIILTLMCAIGLIAFILLFVMKYVLGVA